MRRELRQPGNIVLQLIVAVELCLQHLIGGAGVGIGAVGPFELLAAVELHGSREGALLHLVEDDLHVDKLTACHVEVDTGTEKLLGQQGHIEAV